MKFPNIMLTKKRDKRTGKNLIVFGLQRAIRSIHNNSIVNQYINDDGDAA